MWKPAPNSCRKITRSLAVYRAHIPSSNVSDSIKGCMSVWKKRNYLEMFGDAKITVVYIFY
jgi:hypothetical protein